MSRVKLVWLIFGTVLLAGCSGAQPMEYHDPTDTPKGPGLFTGESGEKKITIGGDDNTQTH